MTDYAPPNSPAFTGVPSAPVSKVEPRQPLSLLEFVAMAVKDPAIDVAKLDTLLRMQREILADYARVEFNTAMNAAQKEIQPVARNTENTVTRSFYAKLEAIDAAIRPIYLEHGFALTYDTVKPEVAGQIRVQCRCTHIGGHSEIYHREAAADTLGPKGSPTKTALHGGASTETFLKKYLVCGIFNVMLKNQDDDGTQGGMRLIDALTVAQLADLVTQVGADLPAFLRFMGVPALVDIKLEDYSKAVNALMAKRRPLESPAKAPPEPVVDEQPPGTPHVELAAGTAQRIRKEIARTHFLEELNQRGIHGPSARDDEQLIRREPRGEVVWDDLIKRDAAKRLELAPLPDDEIPDLNPEPPVPGA